MTSQFRFIFTRYDRQTCNRVQSGPQFTRAETFAGAFMNASLVMMGLEAANPRLINMLGVSDGPRYEYAIASVAAEGYGGEWVQSDIYGMFGDHKPAEEAGD